MLITAERPWSLAVSTPVPFARLVQVGGELDLLTTPLLMKCILDVLRDLPRHFVLDMNGITFMGASGLGALVYVRDQCAQHRVELHVTGARNRAVAWPMKLVKLDRLLTPRNTWRDALDVIAAQSITARVDPSPLAGPALHRLTMPRTGIAGDGRPRMCSPGGTREARTRDKQGR